MVSCATNKLILKMTKRDHGNNWCFPSEDGNVNTYVRDVTCHTPAADVLGLEWMECLQNELVSIPLLKSQVVYSKQPKLGLTQEFVVDCAHALWVVRSIKRLVSLMLLKWFLSDSFIYFMYRMFNEIF